MSDWLVSLVSGRILPRLPRCDPANLGGTDKITWERRKYKDIKDLGSLVSSVSSGRSFVRMWELLRTNESSDLYVGIVEHTVLA